MSFLWQSDDRQVLSKKEIQPMNEDVTLIHWTNHLNSPPLHRNQNVVIHRANDSVIVVSQQTHSTPGVLLKELNVTPNTEYKFEVEGFATSQNAFILVYQNKQRLLSEYTFLPLNTNGTVKVVFNSNMNTTINAGVCFTSPQIGNTIYLKEMTLTAINRKGDQNYPVSEKLSSSADGNVIQERKESVQQYLTWTAWQHKQLINHGTHTQLSQNVVQVNVTGTSKTPGTFIEAFLPRNKYFRFNVIGYSNHNFRLCVFDKTISTELSQHQVDIKQFQDNHMIEFKTEDDGDYLLGISATENVMKGQSCFIESMTLSEIPSVSESFLYSSKQITTMFAPNAHELRNQTQERLKNEHLESPGYNECLESPGLDDMSTAKKKPNRSVQPRQIPAEIKNIEVQIFDLIDSINEMNIDLSRTEKKLIEKIKSNTQ